jgi:hypothetical protein
LACDEDTFEPSSPCAGPEADAVGVTDGDTVGIVDGLAVLLADGVGVAAGVEVDEVDEVPLHPLAIKTAANIAVPYRVSCRRYACPHGHESIAGLHGAQPIDLFKPGKAYDICKRHSSRCLGCAEVPGQLDHRLLSAGSGRWAVRADLAGHGVSVL